MCVGMCIFIIFIIIITNCIKTFKFKKKRGKAHEGHDTLRALKSPSSTKVVHARS